MGLGCFAEVDERLKSILVMVTDKPEHIPNDDVGYWNEPKTGNRFVAVLDVGNPDYSLLVAVHEMIEQHLCMKHGVTAQAVTLWDAAWDRRDGQPGDHPDAPYHREHAAATKVERALAEVLVVNWDEYEHALEAGPYVSMSE
jgi:hypothetical protein